MSKDADTIKTVQLRVVVSSDFLTSDVKFNQNTIW